jgi:hypothetical protein
VDGKKIDQNAANLRFKMINFAMLRLETFIKSTHELHNETLSTIMGAKFVNSDKMPILDKATTLMKEF